MKLTVFGIGLGLVIALPLVFMQVYGNRLFKVVALVYERALRSIPLLVILFLVYYGLPEMGIRPPAFSAAGIAIGIRSAAYQSQIFRGAIQSVSGSQMKAALSLGMSNVQAFVSIILPQALRAVVPPFTNETAIVLKDTSLAYAVGVIEIVQRGQYIISDPNNDPLIIFMTIAAIYFVITYVFNHVMDMLEEKMKIPGIGLEERAYE